MPEITIATWNVNSIRVRLQTVLDWLAVVKPDILALQETKVVDKDFPSAPFQQAGYFTCFSGQKAYNGVAVLSRMTMENQLTDFPNWWDSERRLLAVTIGHLRLFAIYVPNGETVTSVKYQYKLGWLAALTALLKAELQQHHHLIVVGDFNIAPAAIDVYDPKRWEGKVLFSEPERQAFKHLLALGLQDCFRLHIKAGDHYSWWDYRTRAFDRGRGLRIDHLLASKALASQCRTCWIDVAPRGQVRPSDHAPIIAKFLCESSLVGTA